MIQTDIRLKKRLSIKYTFSILTMERLLTTSFAFCKSVARLLIGICHGKIALDQIRGDIAVLVLFSLRLEKVSRERLPYVILQ